MVDATGYTRSFDRVQRGLDAPGAAAERVSNLTRSFDRVQRHLIVPSRLYEPGSGTTVAGRLTIRSPAWAVPIPKTSPQRRKAHKHSKLVHESARTARLQLNQQRCARLEDERIVQIKFLCATEHVQVTLAWLLQAIDA